MKPKRPYRRIDINAQLAFESGRRARTEGLKITDFPKMERYVGLRANELKAIWERGWKERHAELDQWLPYKG